MDCRTAAPLLPQYLDGELDRETVAELEAHVDGCATCAEELSELDHVRQSVRKRAVRYPAPESLRRRLEAASNAAPRERRSVRPWWISLAASLVVAVAVSYTTTAWLIAPRLRPAASEDLAVHDLLSGHLRALAAASPVDVVSTNRHTVKPWFDGRITAVPPVIDLSKQGFALIGGRIDYVHNQRVAVVVYRHRGHLIDLYFIPSGGPQTAPAQRRMGYALIPVTLKQQSAWIVSDLDAHELGEFQRLLAQQR